MRVSIPTRDENGLEGIVEQHFGKAPTYTIIDTETDQVMVIPNTSEHMGGVGLPPEYLNQNGVDVMLCGGLGFKAVRMFVPSTGMRSITSTEIVSFTPSARDILISIASVF